MSAATVNALDPEARNGRAQHVDWLLLNADWVVTCDEQMTCIQSGAIAIEGDRIVDVGPSVDLEKRFNTTRRLDLRGHLALPGLVNTHTHGAMSCFRGLGDDLPLHRWLHELIFPAERKHVNPEMVYWGTLLSIVEMLQNGITTFCDGYFWEEEAAKASLDSGIRAVLGQGILDFPTPDQQEPSRAKDRAESFLASFPWKESRLRPSLFCHSLYTCSPETLAWVKQLCREQNILFQIHLSETASEVDECITRHGERPACFLDRLGILDENTLCAHCVWLDPQEIKVLAARSIGVAHCPESNMKLASGTSPVPDMLAAGMKIGVGTDGCASNNNLDLLPEMDMASKLHKVFRKDALACPAPQSLAMGTRLGAEAIGWGSEIGAIRPGKKADIAVIDIRQPHLTPLYNPVSTLVYAARGSDVRFVWVDGRQVVSEGRVVTVDVAEVMRKVKIIAERIKADSSICWSHSRAYSKGPD